MRPTGCPTTVAWAPATHSGSAFERWDCSGRELLELIETIGSQIGEAIEDRDR